jgi:hypothetical protein
MGTREQKRKSGRPEPYSGRPGRPNLERTVISMTSSGIGAIMRRGSQVMFTLIVGFVLTLGGAQAASAADYDSHCDLGEGCQYRIAGADGEHWGTGGQVDTVADVYDYYNYNYKENGSSNGIISNDKASKLWCRGRTHNCRWFEDKSHEGWSVKVLKGNSKDIEGTSQDNRISSLGWYQ